MKRYIRYHKRQVKPYRAYWKGWLWFGLFLVVLICFIGRGYAEADKHSALEKVYKVEADKNSALVTQLITQNDQLKTQRDIATASAAVVHPTLSDQAFNTIIALLFPPEAAQRYKTIVTKCENSTRNPLRTNYNKDGTVDLGVSQINQVHAAQVSSIFGESFWSAMSDSVKNMVYASYIYHTQGNFSAWTCDHLL